MKIDMTYWCESCARKNNCYTIRSRPKCFVAITNTDRKTESGSYKCSKCDGEMYFKVEPHIVGKHADVIIIDEPQDEVPTKDRKTENCSEKPNKSERSSE